MTVTSASDHFDDPESPFPPGLFRALHEHSSDIVTILEPDGSWRSTSPAGTRLLGWPPGYDPGGAPRGKAQSMDEYATSIGEPDDEGR